MSPQYTARKDRLLKSGRPQVAQCSPQSEKLIHGPLQKGESELFQISTSPVVLMQVQEIGRHGTVRSPARGQRLGSWAALRELLLAQWQYREQSLLLRQSLSLSPSQLFLRVCTVTEFSVILHPCHLINFASCGHSLIWEYSLVKFLQHM